MAERFATWRAVTSIPAMAYGLTSRISSYPHALLPQLPCLTDAN